MTVSEAHSTLFPPSDYLFGLWKNDLGRGLLWHVVRSRGQTENGPNERLPFMFAPTQSWASLPEGEMSSWYQDCSTQDTYIEIQNISFKFLTPNKFGPGTGVLTIRNCIATIRWDNSFEGSTPLTSGAFKYEARKLRHGMLLEVSLDLDPGSPEGLQNTHNHFCPITQTNKTA
ncbi:hypothetical protein B0J14DRAFT_653119 [Halenospora varia]|nr:hypothetical protein B0J14DRAFT_653119 [Halenospora varia]